MLIEGYDETKLRHKRNCKKKKKKKKEKKDNGKQLVGPASILYISIAGRYRPVSYLDRLITARYIYIKNAYYWCGPDHRQSSHDGAHYVT